MQAGQTATAAGRSTDAFVGWRKPVAFVRAKVRRTSSVTQMRDEVHLNFVLKKATGFLQPTEPSVLRPSDDQPDV